MLVQTVVTRLAIVVWFHAQTLLDPARSDAAGDWLLVKPRRQPSHDEDGGTIGTEPGIHYKFVAAADVEVFAYRTPGWPSLSFSPDRGDLAARTHRFGQMKRFSDYAGQERIPRLMGIRWERRTT